MLKWINFLHFYQPANIEQHLVIEATEKSYQKIIAKLEKYPDAKFTINISGCLVERWVNELNYAGLVKRIEKLIRKGQLELVGSAAYHALLPLVKPEEAINQIKENEKILKKHFGPNLKLKGFFLPEMAYSANISKLIKNLGYQWLILDEISLNGKLQEADALQNYHDLYSGLGVIFRSRKYSQKYVPSALLKKLNNNGVFITATDAELYGLRHVDMHNDLGTLLKAKQLETETISEFFSKINKKAIDIKPVSSSWESTEDELKENLEYALWYDSKSLLHKKLWELADLAQNLHYKHKKNTNLEWSRWHLVRGIQSCTFWWASGKDLSHVFGPVAWNPDEINKGANELIRSVRSLEKSTTLPEKLAAEKIYNDIIKILWECHWKKYSKKHITDDRR